MIKAVIFDLDNTLLDFMKMKSSAVNAGILGMIEAGMKVEKEETIKHIFEILKNLPQKNQLFDPIEHTLS